MTIGREELEAATRTVIDPGSPTKAAVLICEKDGRRFVVKDLHPQHAWFRSLLGRRVMSREIRALRVLDAVAGVPRFLGRLDDDAFTQEYMDGVPMRGRLSAGREADFRAAAMQLPQVVDSLHALGVVHLDLRQRRNILVREGGGVTILDFESSMRFRTTGIQGVVFRWLARMDRAACLKFGLRFAPECLTEAEQARARRQERLSQLWIFHRFGPLLRLLLRQKGRLQPPNDRTIA